jgi:hypothetical protein
MHNVHGFLRIAKIKEIKEIDFFNIHFLLMIKLRKYQEINTN